MKTKILCIIGKSGSGKDTFANFLQAESNHHLVVSNTTRPIRGCEVNGREHNFMTQCNATCKTKVAYTVYGGYEYWTVKSDFLQDRINLYIIDEQGYYDMKKHLEDSNFDIRVIYIRRKNKSDISTERTVRDIHRKILNPEDIDYFVDNKSSLAYLHLEATRVNNKLSEWLETSQLIWKSRK